jgi:hypothetical protein
MWEICIKLVRYYQRVISPKYQFIYLGVLN